MLKKILFGRCQLVLEACRGGRVKITKFDEISQCVCQDNIQIIHIMLSGLFIYNFKSQDFYQPLHHLCQIFKKNFLAFSLCPFEVLILTIRTHEHQCLVSYKCCMTNFPEGTCLQPYISLLSNYNRYKLLQHSLILAHF